MELDFRDSFSYSVPFKISMYSFTICNQAKTYDQYFQYDFLTYSFQK